MTAWRNYGQKKEPNKYHAEKVEVDGEKFDSRKEARRWQDLRLLEKAGEISDLRRQVKYTLIPAQREEPTFTKTGKPKLGAVIEREVAYVADFQYLDNRTGETVVEDVKGYRDPGGAAYKVFVLKRKLMLWVHKIRVREI